MNSSGLSVVYKLNFSIYDVQRIVNGSSVFLRPSDVLPEAFRIFERCWRNQRMSTSNETVSTVLKDACYPRASLLPPPLTPPLTQCG